MLSHLSPPFGGKYGMINYEDVPDNHWMLIKSDTKEVLFNSSILEEVINKSNELDNEETYISKKHYGVINL